MNTKNFIRKTDSYKFTHWNQFPDDTTFAQYYIEARGGPYDKIFVGGIARLVKDLASVRITMEDVEETREMVHKHFGQDLFNYEGWKSIVTDYGGRLPIRIRAPKEGTLVPVRNVVMLVEPTDKKFAWLPGHLEPS